MSRLTLKELQTIYWRQLMLLLGCNPDDKKQQDLVRLSYQDNSQPNQILLLFVIWIAA